MEGEELRGGVSEGMSLRGWEAGRTLNWLHGDDGRTMP